MERQLTDEELKGEIALFDSLVEIMPDPRRGQVKTMMAGKVGEVFFTAPASSRLEFHSCYPGGLLVHSINVVKHLRKLAKALAPGKYDDATLAFVGLFHDLGKVGDGDKEMYLPEESDWHRNKLGQMYQINKDLQYMPNSERSLYILQKSGIELATEEYLAIRLNDGMYDQTNKNYAMKEPGLALLVHFADRWACELEKAST